MLSVLQCSSPEWTTLFEFANEKRFTNKLNYGDKRTNYDNLIDVCFPFFPASNPKRSMEANEFLIHINI